VSFVVQLIVRVIVRDYERTVMNRLIGIYTRRWAATPPGSREFGMLRLARLETERVSNRLPKSGAGLPTFLVGGAALSGVASAFQALAAQAEHNDVVLVAIAGAFGALALGAFWCILNGAAVARRRTHIALDQPLHALWQTIGSAGNPPRDKSRQFATYAALLFFVAWIVVPAAIAYAALRP
jgi:hypothetical protein